MEGCKVEAAAALEGKEESSSPAQLGPETAAASSSPAIFGLLARPLSLLRHAARGCAGYLGGIASRLKPAAAPAPATAAACQSQQEEVAGEGGAGDEEDASVAVTVQESAVVVQVRSRGMTRPQQPRNLREGRGGNGGAHR